MLFYIASILILSCVSGSLGSVCPKIKTQNPFDVSKYVGFWYEAYRSNVIFEFASKCVNATYTPNPDGSVGVWNQDVNWLGDYTSIRGTARVKNASEPAAFIVTFDNPIQKGDYNVITSNYDEYSVVYSCGDIPVVEKKLEFIWILSRNKTLSDTVVEKLKDTLNRKNRRKSRKKQKCHRQRRRRRARMKYQSKFVNLMSMSTTDKTIKALNRMTITSSEERNEFEFINRHQITRHHILKMRNNDRPPTDLDQLEEQRFCSTMSEINSYDQDNDHHSSFV